MKLSNVLVIGVVSSLAACGGDEDGLSQEQALGKVAQTFCERSFDCEANSPEPLEYANVAECVVGFKAALESDEQAAIEASIAAGRISWNEDDAAYCVVQINAALNDLSCSVFFEQAFLALGSEDPRCLALGTGLVADGDACTIDDDCAAEGSLCIALVCGQPQ